MKIQSNNQINFGQKYPFLTPQKRAAIMRAIEKKNISPAFKNIEVNRYAEDGKFIYTGKNIKEYINNQKEEFAKLVEQEKLEAEIANRKLSSTLPARLRNKPSNPTLNINI